MTNPYSPEQTRRFRCRQWIRLSIRQLRLMGGDRIRNARVVKCSLPLHDHEKQICAGGLKSGNWHYAVWWFQTVDRGKIVKWSRDQ